MSIEADAVGGKSLRLCLTWFLRYGYEVQGEMKGTTRSDPLLNTGWVAPYEAERSKRGISEAGKIFMEDESD